MNNLQNNRNLTQSSKRRLKSLFAILLMIIFLFPLYWMLNVSFQPGFVAVNTPLLPLKPSLRGYEMAIHDQKAHIFNSILYSISAVLVTLLLTIPAAFALAKFKIRGVKFFLLLALITQMIPGVVIANALYNFYVKANLLNTFPGIVLALAATGIPFSLLLITANMQNLPREILEAAEIDGAKRFRMLIQIVVPISKNVIITSGVFSFLFAWGDFIYSVALITDPSKTPITVSLYKYVGGYIGMDFSPILATAVISSIPGLFLLLFAQRYIREGLTTGSLK